MHNRLHFARGVNAKTRKPQMQADIGDGYIRVAHDKCAGMFKDSVDFIGKDIFALVKPTASYPGIMVVELVRPLNEIELREEIRKRVESTIKPAPPTRTERRKHSRSEFDRQLRQSMKGVNPPADKHGHRKQKTA
jgi:hypothetical protein